MSELTQHPTEKYMVLLSRLMFPPIDAQGQERRKADFLNLSREDFDQLVELANSNHVIVRGMNLLLEMTRAAHDDVRTAWAEEALATEEARIHTAVPVLNRICKAFDEEKRGVTVIKSLDHWPDLGSDLDLYTNATPEQTLELMQRRFQAKISERSWGDRLARKWNFEIPGLPESVEIHVGRLGQTGEQAVIASRLLARTRTIEVMGLPFRVTSVSDRILISTLQRMYRHFYFRLCDIVDSGGLIESCAIDYDDLRAAATAAEIWEGTATYLVIVSDYIKQYRGEGPKLPAFVTRAAKFGGKDSYYLRSFIRVPIMPQSAKLYGSQLGGLIRQGDLTNSARLTLLPWLATAAFVGQKITGSDKGIW